MHLRAEDSCGVDFDLLSSTHLRCI